MRFWYVGWTLAGLLLAVVAASAQEQGYGVQRGRPSPYWDYQRSSFEPTPADEAAPRPPATQAPQPAPMPQEGQAGGCSSCYGDALADDSGYSCDVYSGAPRCPWYVSLAGLVMTHDAGNEVFTTYDATNINNQMMNTQEADVDWRGGFEVVAGRRFGCACDHGIELRYWTTDEMEGSASRRRDNNTLSTPLDAGFLVINGTPAGTFFDNAREHRISRSSEFHNLEINLLHYSLTCPCDALQLSCLAGVRYFRFDHDLAFSSVRGGSEFGANGGLDEAHLTVDVENNLVGFQVGARADYQAGCRWKLFTAPVIGVYNNHVTNSVSIHDGAGNLGVGTTPAPENSPVTYPLNSSEDDVAILAQLDIGVEYQISCCWRAFAGYRAVAVTGVALSDNQIPHFMIDAPEWQNIDTNGSLILHGAFLGLECRF